MIEEEFRAVKGYEGLYEVSNYGRVRSLKNGKERILKGAINCDGYLYVDLCKNSRHLKYYIHRLVAIAAIPNPYGLPQVNHINEDKQSNVVTNLEWCDAKYNVNYGTATQRRSKCVYQYSVSGEFVAEYPSIREAARQNGIWHSSINHCCNSTQNSAGGYVWSFDPPTPSTTRSLW